MSMITNPFKPLEKKEAKLKSLVEIWNLKLQKHQNARLMTALFFCASLIPIAMFEEASWLFAISGFLILVFAFLVVRTKHIQRHHTHLTRLWQFYTRQLNRRRGKPSGRQWQQAEALASEYAIIRDIGLVGPHSLWTLVDETLSEGGMRKLLSWMSVSPQKVETLRNRQNKIQNLSSQMWFYTRLNVTANSNELNLSTFQIQDFLKTPFVSNSFTKLLAANLGLWILSAGLLFYAVETKTHLPTLLFALFPILSMLSLSAVGNAFGRGTGLLHHLEALTPIFSAIEKKATTNKELAALCPHIKSSSPSRSTKNLEIVLSFLGTQTNPILHFLLNVLCPWTVTAVFFLERLRKKVENDFPICLDELAELEVIGSLLILQKYQTQNYPEFKNSLGLECEQIFHPLLERTKAVANDFSFTPGKSLGLLTGSNMSGKSTFLRTIGINQILANMGAPVFAKSMKTQPMKVETCIEVSDSLRDGYSYFYAEVRRLKDILAAAASTTPVLFLIDEIFRGTNNRERQIGSRAVIKALAGESSALGFISTHDLELTVLEEKNQSLMNLHFKEDIDENGKMVFSYHLNHGPCPTTNALRIMAAEGIPVE